MNKGQQFSSEYVRTSPIQDLCICVTSARDQPIVTIRANFALGNEDFAHFVHNEVNVRITNESNHVRMEWGVSSVRFFPRFVESFRKSGFFLNFSSKEISTSHLTLHFWRDMWSVLE